MGIQQGVGINCVIRATGRMIALGGKWYAFTNLRDGLRCMYSAQLLLRRQWCIATFEEGHYTAGDEMVVDGLQPRRRFWVPFTHLMQQAFRMREKSGDHHSFIDYLI
jgi:hypothetical protein